MDKPIFLKESINARVSSGVKGWIAGATLGAPFQGKPDWRNLTFYTPIPNRMAQTFGVDAGALYLAAEPEPTGLGDLWLSGLKLGDDAHRFGFSNLKSGLRAPLSGRHANPFAQTGTALGRAPFWGLRYAGQPALAAKWAWHDASLDHTDNGVHLACFWAAAIAAAPFVKSLSDCLAIAEFTLPKDSSLRGIGASMIQGWQAGRTWQDSREAAVAGRLVEGADATHAFALIGLLYGQADFAKAVSVAAGCGGCTQEVAGAVGAIIAAGTGFVPEDWLAPLGTDLIVSAGTSHPQLPKTIQEFANRVLSSDAPYELADQLPPDFVPPVEEGQPAKEPIPYEPDRGFLADFSAFTPGQRLDESLFGGESLLIGISYPDLVALHPGKSVGIAVRLENLTDIAFDVEPTVEGDVGHRAQRIRIEPKSSSSFPIVAKTPGMVRIQAGAFSAFAPVIPCQTWWVTGPFDNRESLGYEKAYMPERDFNPDAVFSDRSGQTTRWEPFCLDGPSFDLEPMFVKAAGVVYMTAECRFDNPGAHTLLLASSVGQVVWVNGEKRSWYQDTHLTNPKPVAPYVTSFDADGWVRFLFKFVRNDGALAPMTMYFLDGAGRLSTPVETRHLSETAKI